MFFYLKKKHSKLYLKKSKQVLKKIKQTVSFWKKLGQIGSKPLTQLLYTSGFHIDVYINIIFN